MVLLAEKRRLLWFGPVEMPENVSAAVNTGWDILPCSCFEAISERLDEARVILIAPSAADLCDPRQLSRLLDRIDRSGSVAVVLLPAGLTAAGPLSRRCSQFIIADAGSSPAELAARLESAAALQPVIEHLRADVAAVRGFGNGVADNFEELDEEMRLAARLQRDFLPRSLPQVGPVRFAALFRPAGWVSGDIYDIFRLDETHVGFYVADVVGHGMPAALLTMFIKKAMQTKRIAGDHYEIIPPGQVLEHLNTDICEQQLGSCQFCTAVYGVVDTERLLLRYARGGHPRPLLLESAGSVKHLGAVGALLGVFSEETFEGQEVQLSRGDRLVVFSDGAEEMLSSESAADGDSALTEALQSLQSLPGEQMVLQLTRQIDEHRLAGRRDDDVTVVVMDVTD